MDGAAVRFCVVEPDPRMGYVHCRMSPRSLSNSKEKRALTSARQKIRKGRSNCIEIDHISMEEMEPQSPLPHHQ
jgi:hypothetical protein